MCCSFQLEAAKKIIEDLLTPKEDENNDWKRSQLRELGALRAPRQFGALRLD